MIKRAYTLSIVVAGVVVSLAAHAAPNASVDRQALMKNVGAATKVAAGMVKVRFHLTRLPPSWRCAP